MRMGLVPPVVQRNPRFGPAAWEAEAGVEELASIAEAADRLGYEFLSFPNHVAIPAHVAPLRGATYWDPAATMGYIAARTHRIRLAAYVIVLGYYHPLQIAKTFGTLDRLSDGRLILGVGVGSLREEFDLLGVAFEDRGARADDALRALRAALSIREPVYEGEHYRFRDMIVEPHAVQERVPIWVGGRTRRSLRRALELADGWAPFGLTIDVLTPMLADARALLSERPGFDVVLPPEPPLDPAGDPARAAETVERYRAVGATMLNLRFANRSLAHYLEQLEAMQEIVRATGTGGGASGGSR